MAGMSVPRERRTISGATLSLIAVAFSELRGDLGRLLESAWDEPVRRRAEELSTVLAQACERQGLQALVKPLRSTANLARLSKATAMPVLPALREKFGDLIREIQSLLPR